MPTDRRQFKRFETLLIVEIGPQQESTPYFFGITKDISFEGFIFESQNYDLQTGDILEFRLKHPKNDLSVPVFGEIVWNRETKFECHSGVKFHKVDNETKNKMFTLISSDMTDDSRYASLVEEFRGTTKRNGEAARGSEEREDMLSDIIDQASASKNGVQIDQGDMLSGAVPTVNGGKHADNGDDGPDGMKGPDKSITIDNQQPHTQKKEGKSIHGNISRTAAGPIPARRKSHKKSTSYALSATVFFVLFLATALLLFVPNDIREKIIPPSLKSIFIKITDSISSGGGAPVMHEINASEPPPVLMSQSESLPDDTSQTAEDHTLAGAGMQIDDGHEVPADHDYIGADDRSEDLPVAEQDTEDAGADVLSPEADTASDDAVVSVEIQSARVEEDKGAGKTTLEGADVTDRHKSETEETGSEKQEVKQNETIDWNELKPVTEARETEKEGEETPQPVKKKRLRRSPGEKKVRAASSEKIKALSAAIQEESGVQEDVALQKPAGAAGNAPEKKKPVITHDREKAEAVQMAVNASGSMDDDGGSTIERMKEPESVVRNDASEGVQEKSGVQEDVALQKPDGADGNAPEKRKIVENMTGPAKRVTVETLTAGTGNPEELIGEQEKSIQLSEEKPAVTMSVPKMRDVENIPSQNRSKQSAGMKGMPKIALVVSRNPVNVPAVKEKPPGITDEYLKKYFTVYTDPFDDNSNKWDVFDIGEASSRIEDGFYHIENRKQGGALIVLHYQRFPHEADFIIETEIKAISGPDGSSYGLIFGAKDARNNYSFQIRENKYYAVKTYRHGVSGQVTSGEIKDLFRNKDAAALLKIVKQADGIYFFINNRYVDKVSNLKFFGNRIGFIVEGKSRVAIDYTRSFIRKAASENTN